MDFKSFVKLKATEKGIKNCPNCGKEDVFYALGSICYYCQKRIPQNPRFISLQFSFEVFTEFFKRYDKHTAHDSNKEIIVQFLEDAIMNISKNNSLENETIIKIQHLIKTLDGIGSNAFGFLIKNNLGKPSVVFLENYVHQYNDTEYRMISVSALLFAIQYILAFEVQNEFVIPTPTSIQKKSTQQTPKKASKQTSTNSGCGMILIWLFTGTSSIYGLYSLLT